MQGPLGWWVGAIRLARFAASRAERLGPPVSDRAEKPYLSSLLAGPERLSLSALQDGGVAIFSQLLGIVKYNCFRQHRGFHKIALYFQ